MYIGNLFLTKHTDHIHTLCGEQATKHKLSLRKSTYEGTLLCVWKDSVLMHM